MTSQSAEAIRMNAEREAELAAQIERGKEAAAQRQAASRAAHAAEVAARKAADDAMGIPANWTEPRKAMARQKHADRQRAAQVEAERAANSPKPVNPAQHRGWRPLPDIAASVVTGPRGPCCATFKGRK